MAYTHTSIHEFLFSFTGLSARGNSHVARLSLHVHLLFNMFVDNPQNSEMVNVNGDSKISQSHDDSLEGLIVNTNITQMQTATPSSDLPGNSQSTREDNLSPAEDDQSPAEDDQSPAEDDQSPAEDDQSSPPEDYQSPEPNIIYLNAVRAAETIVLTCSKHVGK